MRGFAIKRGQALFLLSAACILALSLWPVNYLVIRDRKTGRTLYSWRTKAGDSFMFRYIHSVENIPVTGVFLVREDGRIEAAETRFSSFGTGLPLFVPPRHFFRKKGEMIVKQKGYFLHKLPVVCESITKQHIIYGGRKVFLANKARDGAIIDILIEKRPFIYGQVHRLIDRKS